MKRHSPILAFLLLATWGALSSWCGENTHDFARWEKEISGYEQMDRTNPPPKGGVLFIGSSTIRMWKTLGDDFPGAPVINRGFGGSEIVDATHFADRIVFPYEPQAIFFRSGGNDIHNGRSPGRVFGDFVEFVKTVHARLPRTEIFFISWSPSASRWKEAADDKKLNQLVREYAQRTPRVHYIETYSIALDADGNPRPELFLSDKLHFNAAGYKLLADRVRPFVPGQR